MKKREKILLATVASICGIFATGFAIRAVIILPLHEWDGRIDAVREKMGKIQAERRTYFAAEEKVKAYVQRTFALTEDQVSAESGERLTRLIMHSGLSEADFTRTPLGPRLLRTGLKTTEVGWSVHGDGKLEHVINLLFLLQESPYIRRIDSVTLSTGEGPGNVRVGFRYLTLVVKPAPEVDPIDLPDKIVLDTPERRILDSIVSRDLLRPYIKASAAALAGASPAAPGAPPASAAIGGPETFRVVSLSEWMGEPEVHVRDLTNQKTLRYKPGDTLAGGTVVMVDYRPLPIPGNEALKSFSRVIVKIGPEFWAIERGRTLAERYRLAPGQLPEHLGKVVN